MKILYRPYKGFCQHRQGEKQTHIYPVLLAMEAEWYRRHGHTVVWDEEENGIYDKKIFQEEGIPFLELPHADRVLTQFDKKNRKWLYQNNGNFKYFPATYIQSARDCWWRKCKFCSWAVKYPTYECRDVHDVLDEINECASLGFQEIFDDSGTFPVGKWLDNFLIHRRGVIHPKISCNMRLIPLDYDELKECGFRMILFGVESANQKTLDLIGKGTKEEDVKYVIRAAKAGLEPHISVMFGYPWETDEEATRTLQLVHFLLKKGYAKTAQASFYSPSSATEGYNSGFPNYKHRAYVKRIYEVSCSPTFWFNKIKDIKDTNDLKYLWKAINTGIKEWR